MVILAQPAKGARSEETATREVIVFIGCISFGFSVLETCLEIGA
jgi:hypothetical protein